MGEVVQTWPAASYPPGSACLQRPNMLSSWTGTSLGPPPARSRPPLSGCRCAALQDGTLLDSRSRVLPSSVAAIKAALARGVTVFLATGKARPAAIKAMEAVGLAGEGLVASRTGPGIFLQGGRGWVLGKCLSGSSYSLGTCRVPA